MTSGSKTTMRTVAIDRFGGPDALAVHALPVPGVGPHDVVIRVEYAGVGEWDPFEREGGYAQMLGVPSACRAPWMHSLQRASTPSC